MAEETEHVVQQQLRSPRSAAIAGIVFSILLIIIMALTTRISRVSPGEISSEWLESWTGTVSLVLTLLPFAGIAFLWFTGVVRDRLGRYEDRFFSNHLFE
jgi:predicted acyltransferase